MVSFLRENLSIVVQTHFTINFLPVVYMIQLMVKHQLELDEEGQKQSLKQNFNETVKTAT